MKKLFQLAIILFLASTVNANECDTYDPICVASIVFEKGAALRYFELRDYYCKQNEIFLNEAIKRSEKRISELKRNKGIDHYKEVRIDFSRLNYVLIERSEDKARIRVSGVFTYGLPGKNFHHEASTDELIDLIYQNDTWMFCSEELAKRSERFNRANQ